MECRLDYHNLPLRLLLSRSMSAVHSLTDYHFQLAFNFSIPSMPCPPRRTFRSRYAVNIFYFSYPCFISRPSHSPCLTIVKAFRVKLLRITALDICFNFHPPITSYKSSKKALSNGDVLGRE